VKKNQKEEDEPHRPLLFLYKNPTISFFLLFILKADLNQQSFALWQ
jgi:hypothetical protein